jgi:hypothetical protein
MPERVSCARSGAMPVASATAVRVKRVCHRITWLPR